MRINPKNDLQPAYVLHTRAYQETSLLVELLTEQGRISVIAKGAKRPKSSYRGILQPFNPLLVGFTGRHELKTLTYAEVTTHQKLLQEEYLLAGLYVNELLIRLLLKEAPCTFVFSTYEKILLALHQQEDLWICLRLFEKGLLKALGYELNLLYEVDSGQMICAAASYIYLLEKGPQRIEDASCAGAQEYVFLGKSLLDLAQENLADQYSRKQAKYLLKQTLQFYLGAKPLVSQGMGFRRDTTDCIPRKEQQI